MTSRWTRAEFNALPARPEPPNQPMPGVWYRTGESEVGYIVDNRSATGHVWYSTTVAITDR